MAQEEHAADEAALTEKYGFDWKDNFAGKLADVEFPPFAGIQINMMPIVMGDPSSIPEEYRSYAPLVEKCISTRGPGSLSLPGGRELRGAVGFLSVWESVVSPGESQRRPGLHVEASPDPALEEQTITPFFAGSRALFPMARSPAVKIGAVGGGVPIHHWGGRELGLYQASTVADTCRIWDAIVQKPGPLGDCEELRPVLTEAEGTLMGANELWWLTDVTPHESLPVVEETPRQWFRLVSQDVTVWYEQHSTPNPLVPLPTHIHVATHHKFSDDLVKAAK